VRGPAAHARADGHARARDVRRGPPDCMRPRTVAAAGYDAGHGGRRALSTGPGARARSARVRAPHRLVCVLRAARRPPAAASHRRRGAALSQARALRTPSTAQAVAAQQAAAHQAAAAAATKAEGDRMYAADMKYMAELEATGSLAPQVGQPGHRGLGAHSICCNRLPARQSPAPAILSFARISARLHACVHSCVCMQTSCRSC